MNHAEKENIIMAENKVLYPPGQEPDDIKKQKDRLFEKIDTAYPDKVITSFRKNHKQWAKDAGKLRVVLGYADNSAFFVWTVRCFCGGTVRTFFTVR
jgi:hypothetical protein